MHQTNDSQQVIENYDHLNELRAAFPHEDNLQVIISAYTAGEISIGKAAELIGVSHEAMKDLIVKNGGKLHLGPETMDELLSDIANA